MPRGGLRCRQQQPLPSPLGEGGPAGPDEGQAPVTARPRANRRVRRPLRPAEACADVLPRVTTRGDSRCRQHPRRGQDPSLRTEPLTGVRVPPPGRACPAPTARRPGNDCSRKPHSVSISPSVGRGAPTPPRPPAAALPRANRRGRRPRCPAEACAAANNSPCLPPWGKVAPQGRMRGRLPLPPIPGQAVGGGVPDAPDAPRRLAPTSFPGLPPAETPAAANTRGGVKTPPYGPNH